MSYDDFPYMIKKPDQEDDPRLEPSIPTIVDTEWLRIEDMTLPQSVAIFGAPVAEAALRHLLEKENLSG